MATRRHDPVARGRAPGHRRHFRRVSTRLISRHERDDRLLPAPRTHRRTRVADAMHNTRRTTTNARDLNVPSPRVLAPGRAREPVNWRTGSQPLPGSRRVAAHSYRRRRTSRDSTYVIGIRPTLDRSRDTTRLARGSGVRRRQPLTATTTTVSTTTTTATTAHGVRALPSRRYRSAAATDERTNERRNERTNSPRRANPSPARADTAVQLTPVDVRPSCHACAATCSNFGVSSAGVCAPPNFRGAWERRYIIPKWDLIAMFE